MPAANIHPEYSQSKLRIGLWIVLPIRLGIAASWLKKRAGPEVGASVPRPEWRETIRRTN